MYNPNWCVGVSDGTYRNIQGRGGIRLQIINYFEFIVRFTVSPATQVITKSGLSMLGGDRQYYEVDRKGWRGGACLTWEEKCVVEESREQEQSEFGQRKSKVSVLMVRSEWGSRDKEREAIREQKNSVHMETSLLYISLPCLSSDNSIILKQRYGRGHRFTNR